MCSFERADLDDLPAYMIAMRLETRAARQVMGDEDDPCMILFSNISSSMSRAPSAS